jgi:hypothetical protein
MRRLRTNASQVKASAIFIITSSLLRPPFTFHQTSESLPLGALKQQDVHMSLNLSLLFVVFLLFSLSLFILADCLWQGVSFKRDTAREANLFVFD